MNNTSQIRQKLTKVTKEALMEGLDEKIWKKIAGDKWEEKEWEIDLCINILVNLDFSVKINVLEPKSDVPEVTFLKPANRAELHQIMIQGLEDAEVEIPRVKTGSEDNE